MLCWSNLVPAGGSSELTTDAASVTISFANAAPVARSDAFSTDEDTPLTVAAPGLLGNDGDADGDGLTAALVAAPAHARLTLHPDGSFTYTPVANYNGPDSFTYRASDGNLSSGLATVSLTVASVDDAPTCPRASATTDEDAAIDVTPSCADIDSGALSLAVADQPSHGTASMVAGKLHYTPDADYNGSDSFTYQADDGILRSAVATVAITVAPVNDAPVCSAGTGTTDEGMAVEVMPTCTDVDSATLSFALVDQPAHGTAGVVAGKLRYTPADGYKGPDSFTYRPTTEGCGRPRRRWRSASRPARPPRRPHRSPRRRPHRRP